MIQTGSLNLFISGNLLLLILFLVFLALFSFLVYKYTIPNVSSLLKTFLISLRVLILALILFLIFEPIISLIRKEPVETNTYIYIDNSNSIGTEDSVKKIELTDNFIEELNSTDRVKPIFFPFGDEVDSSRSGKKSQINFSEKQTNFERIIEHINKNRARINSAVILSDGIITEGIDPTYQAEKLQIPLYTVGIGDSSIKSDVAMQNILHNLFIYAGRPTVIEAIVTNFGFENSVRSVSLFEENRLIESKEVTLSGSGINRIPFNYKASAPGERKMSLSVSRSSGEITDKNNIRTFYLNVLTTNFRVCLVAGTPSADVSAISKALSSDKNINLKKLIQVSKNKFWNDEKIALIDSADILFLVDFPAEGTDRRVIEKVSAALTRETPFFFLFTANVDLSMLERIRKTLPFVMAEEKDQYIQVVPEMNYGAYSSNFTSAGARKELWEKLPPVSQLNAGFSPKPGASVIVNSRVKNSPVGNPLVVISSLGNQKVFSILAGDIWRWQLQTAETNPEFFDNFVNDIVKWLNISGEKKQFKLTTDRKVYSPGEEVSLTAELYDRTFRAVDTADITLKIFYNSKSHELNFTPAGNGIYSASFTPSEAGDYNYEGSAILSGAGTVKDSGKFTVDEIQIEKADTRMRSDFLKRLAISAGGDYYSIDNYAKLLDKLKSLNEAPSKDLVRKTDFHLYSNELVLIFIIILFSIEWFIRKRSGMI